MRVVIEFETDNAAFENNFTDEVEGVLQRAIIRVLRRVQVDEESEINEGSDALHDTNGNSIGRVRLSK